MGARGRLRHRRRSRAVSTWRRDANTLQFPRIQGTDIVGQIEAVGEGVDEARIGERVIVDFSLYNRPAGDDSLADIDYSGTAATPSSRPSPRKMPTGSGPN